jgi:hypothetical protein
MKYGLSIVFIFMVFIIISLIYGFGNNGRLIRDYGASSSGISDNEVKSIYCDTWAENNGYDNDTTMVNIFYKKENGKEYCGDIEVKVECIFSNKGDYCSIKQTGGKINGWR